MENHGVKWGVIGGGLSILITMILYFIDPKLIFKVGSWIGIIIGIGVMVKAGLDERASLGGYMSWGEALKPTFICFAVAGLIGVLFSYVFNTFIDPSMLEMQKELALEMSTNMMEKFGADDGAIEEAREQIMNQPDPGIGQTMLGYLFSLIIGFVLASLVSLGVKKNDPNAVA